MKDKTKQFEITHLTNDEYTYLINYITEKENKARQETLDEVEKMIDEIHYQKYVSLEHNCNSEYDYPWFDDEEFKKDIFKQLQKLGDKKK